MTIWNPITPPATSPNQLITSGAQMSVVTPDDMAVEFGSSFNDIDQTLLDLATQKVEEKLHRPLRNAVYRETNRITYDPYTDVIFGATGSIRPHAIPVQKVFAPAGVTIVDNLELRYVTPDDEWMSFWGLSWVEQYGTVTYQGGWTHESLPSTLRTVILKVAMRMYMRKTPGSLMDVAVPGVANPKAGDIGFTTGPRFGSLFDDDDILEMRGYRYRSWV